MKVHFPNQLALYFLRRYLDQRFPDGPEVEWVPFAAPTWTTRFLFDQSEHVERAADLADVLDRVGPGSILCFGLRDIPDYLSLVLLYRQFEERWRDRDSRPRFVVGGSLCFYLDADEFAERFPLVDCLVVGPGEEPFAQIVAATAAGHPLPKLLRGGGDRIRFPDERVLSIRPIYPCALNFDVCEWGRCRFCHHVRPRKVESDCVAEFADDLIRLYRDKKVSRFFVFDNSISAGTLEVLLARLRDQGMAGKIGIDLFGMRLDRRVLEILPLVKETRILTSVEWGLESCSQRILRLWHKGTSASAFEPILRGMASAGVINLLFVLCGLPLSRDSDIRATERGLTQLGPHYRAVSASWFVLDRWLAAFDEREELGIHLKDRYRICDTFGVDFLGPHNLLTHFYDFDSTDGDRGLTRRDDFGRYLGLLSRPEVSTSQFLCFLKSPRPLVQLAMSGFPALGTAAAAAAAPPAPAPRRAGQGARRGAGHRRQAR
ncbi:MAG: hypothetical protein HY906_06760 [Deltaproteobacteria bacterium]|nr:hypothetical protein [Deltaproteobacteria bacterium]